MKLASTRRRLRRHWAAATALPLVMAVGAADAGIAHAAAPGQPGLAAPEQGQPGLTAPPQPPAQPSLADWIPDPGPPPDRPRPGQQTAPQRETLVQPQRSQPAPQPSDNESEDEAHDEPAAQTPPSAPEPARPETFRFGSTTVDVPNWIDPALVAKAQKYSDWAEWWIADGYDRLGFSDQESDRHAASTMAGAGLGAYVGGVLTTPVPALAGCGVGMVAGGLIGFAAGGAVAGVGAPLGATAGIIGGCMVGTAVVGLPAAAVGLVGGGLIGGAIGGAIGAGTNVPAPGPLPPLVELPPPPAPAPVPAPPPVPVVDVGAIQQQVSQAAGAVQQQVAQTADAVQQQVNQAAGAVQQQVGQAVESATQQVHTGVDQFAASSPQAGAAVAGLRDAVHQLPKLTPEQAGPVAAPINDLIGVVSAAVGA